MHIRQIIAALMILLSLSPQARTVFACGMMPADARHACCCPAEGKDRCPPETATGVCCDQMTPADAPFAHSSAQASGRPIDHAQADQTAAGPAPHLLPAAFDTGDGGPPHPYAISTRPSLPLYLLTARLRL